MTQPSVLTLYQPEPDGTHTVVITIGGLPTIDAAVQVKVWAQEAILDYVKANVVETP